MMLGKRIGNKVWPNDFRYRFFIGMHTVDYDQNNTIPGLLSRMNGREIVQQLADAGVDAIYFYASCHCGNCFYPTEVAGAHMHSGLKGRDVFGEAADECQKLGVAFIGVYEFMNLRMVDYGPREWQHYYPEAGPRNGRGLCWNTGYGEMVMRQVDELARRYPMAGMYIDMLNYPGLVCCAGCAQRFKDAVGVLPPRKADSDSLLYRVFWIWVHQEEARYLRELHKILQAYQPGATILNNTLLNYSEDLFYVTDANAYISHDPGIGFGSRLGMVALASQMSIYRALSRGKYPFEVLHDPILLGCYSVVPEEPYCAVTSIARSEGAIAAYSSAMIDREGRLNQAAVQLTKRVNAFVKAREKWSAEGEPIRMAGLYLSQESMLFYGQKLFGSQSTNSYMQEWHGAWLMLQQEHLPTDVLTRRDLQRLGEYPVIYLPDAVCMSDDELIAFRDYVKEGGTLIASYRVATCDEWYEPRSEPGLGEVLGIQRIIRQVEPFIALQLPLAAGKFPLEAWENPDVSMPASALIVEPRKTANVIINLHDRYRYDPAKPTTCLHNAYTQIAPLGPAVLENQYGKGRALYFAGRIFAAYLASGNPTLRKLAARWLIAPEIEQKSFLRLQAPISILMTAWAQVNKQRIIIQLVNCQSAPGLMDLNSGELPVVETILPIYQLVLEVKLTLQQIRQAIVQPDNHSLAIDATPHGTVRIVVPKVHLHEIIVLDLVEGACPIYPSSNVSQTYVQYDLQKATEKWRKKLPPDYNFKDHGALSFEKWRPTEEYLLDWQIAGPFMAPADKLGLLASFLPEQSQASPEIAWQDLCGPEVNRDGFVEMCRLFGNHQGMVGYARTFIHSPIAQRARCWFGNNDNCVIWLNGGEVYRQTSDKQPENGADKVAFEIKLCAGWNIVLVKVENVGHGMGFFMRFEVAEAPIEAAALPERKPRVTGCLSVKTHQWDGRGAGQV